MTATFDDHYAITQSPPALLLNKRSLLLSESNQQLNTLFLPHMTKLLAICSVLSST